jgi:hypothetical protein
VAVAGVQVALDQDEHAFGQFDEAITSLRRATGWLFDAVAREPGPYLLPPMREHGVTIDFMSELFQQARAAGVENLPECRSASAWFEHYRGAIIGTRARFFAVRSWYNGLKTQLHDAVTIIEETNRVAGLTTMVAEAKQAGMRMSEIRKKVPPMQQKRGRRTGLAGLDRLTGACRPSAATWSASTTREI